MNQFLATTTAGFEAAAHHHIVYVNHDQQSAVCSTNLDHAHAVTYIPAQPQQVDEQGNEVSPGVQSSIQIEPANDGHTHTPTAVPLSPPKDPRSDDEKVREVLDLFLVWNEVEKESLKRGRESEEFFMGDQWTPEQKERLENDDRACLTINKIAPHVDELSGYQREQRGSLKYEPVEGGDQRAADMYTVIGNNILENCNFAEEESEVFEDITVTGRGIFNLYIDYSSNIRGEPKIEHYTWDEVVFAPHKKRDLSDCEGLIKHQMFSLANLKRQFPKKKDQLEGRLLDIVQPDSGGSIQYKDDQYNHPSPITLPLMIADRKIVDVALKEARLMECWRKVYIDVPVAINPFDEVYESLFAWKPEDIESVRTLPNFKVTERSVTKFRITKVAGHVLCADEYIADLPTDAFHVVVAYAKKRKNRFWGKVEAVKDPQREINKRHSQITDIGNKMVSYFWMYDDTTFQDEDQARVFRQSGSKPGAHVKVADLKNPPQKVEGPGIPTQLIQMSEFEDQTIAQLMNIQVTEGGANTSAAALEERHKRKLAGNEFLYDSLMFAKKRVFKLLLPLIRRHYTPERIHRIINDLNQKNPVQINGQAFDQYSKDEILQILSVDDVEKYDVGVSEMAYGPTARLSTYALLQDMAQSGQQVPPEVLIKISELPESTKNELITAMQEAAQQTAEGEDKKAQAEIEKTLIAKGVFPKRIQEEYGIDASGQPIEGAGAEQQLPPDMGEVPQGLASY